MTRCLRGFGTKAHSRSISTSFVITTWVVPSRVELQQLSQWFWIPYVAAYDWIVEPNVLAMASYGVGAPKTTCPITRLYWAFLARNAERLAGPWTGRHLRIQQGCSRVCVRSGDAFWQDARRTRCARTWRTICRIAE